MSGLDRRAVRRRLRGSVFSQPNVLYVWITVASGLRRTLFTGTVSAANVDDWLKALKQIFSVEIVDQGINGTHIRSRDNHGNHE
jgi:hypothetical protein